MSRRCQLAFLLLIAFQAMHSVEEYTTRLYEIFAPARFVSGLVSADPAHGFILVNCGFVAVGFGTYFILLRSGHRSAWALAWFWVALELANGIGHIVLAFSVGGYFPGALTAPFLVAVAGGLAVLLRRDHPPGRGSPPNRMERTRYG